MYELFASVRFGLSVRMVLSAGLVAVTVTLSPAASADAEVTKFYNKALSLSGDCTSKPIDDVLDPGCPGGDHPPEGRFNEPSGVAIDDYGNIFVTNRRTIDDDVVLEPHSSYIDIFDSDGFYLNRIVMQDVPNGRGAQDLAIDSTGHLYVTFLGGSADTYRFDPTSYDPAAGDIAYESEPVAIPTGVSRYGSLEIDPANDHLYVSPGSSHPLKEFDAATVDGEPNALITEIPQGVFTGQMALDSQRNRIYVTRGDTFNATPPFHIDVFDQAPPYAKLGTITAPGGSFSEKSALAVDEGNGHLLVQDLVRKRVYEYDENWNYLGELKRPPLYEADFGWMAVDNGENSPNHGFLFLPTGFGKNGHLFAYEPSFKPLPPVVEAVSVSGITEDEATLEGVVNPKGAPTPWVLEYVSAAEFATDGFTFAKIAGQGEIPPGSEGVEVAAPAPGLDPQTAYRFRLRVSHCVLEVCDEGQLEGSFTTFSQDQQSGACANEAFRTGASAGLPDCRAYELVTPANTGGAPPVGPNSAPGAPRFATPPATADGQSVSFSIFGTVIPGIEGGTGGGLSGDPYRSVRTGAGWVTTSVGPTGAQSAVAAPGGLSPDHEFISIVAGEGTAFQQGSLLVNGERTRYLRFPDGSYWLAEGSLGTDPQAVFKYVAGGGSHIIFETGEAGSKAPQLEPNAPPAGVHALYDRTADGATHVISLLPGDVTASSKSIFLGASQDGSSTAFELFGSAGLIYVRVDNETTLEAAPAGSTFAGLSDDGRYLFYVNGGDLYRFDVEDGSPQRLTELGDVRLVNVAATGAAAYFLSDAAVGGPSPSGQEPALGANNLYRWGESGIAFIGSVTDQDAEGIKGSVFERVPALALWTSAVSESTPAELASRTNPEGSVLLFASREDLTDYDSQGKAQIYRYDAADFSLECVSCSRTGTPPTSDAMLLGYHGIAPDPLSPDPDPTGLSRFSDIPNLSADGRRAFFETKERLVVEDNDNVTDVYEWEEQGKGSCAKEGGCIFLISSGQSARPNHLFGVSESGDDVFIRTSDILVPQDTDKTPSIYDARVGGGFAAPQERAGECLGEACQPAVTPRNDATPTSASYQGKGNVVPVQGKRCPKGKRKVKRAGKTLCVPKNKKSKHKKKRSGADRRTHR